MAHIGKHVTMNDPAFVHETAYIYGKVTLQKDVSIWPYQAAGKLLSFSARS